MKFLRLIISLIFVIIFSISLLYNPPVQADSTLLPPKRVIIGTRLMNVQSIDLVENTYKLDFYIWLNWTRIDYQFEKVVELDFLNGDIDSLDLVDHTIGEHTEFVEYRVRGNFVKTLGFKRYPFETHTLSVKIEPLDFNTTDLIYVEDLCSSYDPDVSIIGWDIKGFNTYVTEHVLKTNNNSLSNFNMDLIVERPIFSSFAKNVLPLLIIILISLLTFLTEPSNYESRVGLAISSMLSASAIHITSLTSLPSIGYMTLSDGIMVAVYLVFLYELFISIWIMRLINQRRNEDAVKFNSSSFRLLIVILVVMVSVLTVSF